MALQTASQLRVIEFRSRVGNPAAVYLARLAPSSRRPTRWALRRVVQALGGDDPLAFDWAAVRYPQVVAVRAALAERYSPVTANRMLSALRGVLREAWRLGQIEAEAYYRAIDVPRVRGRSAPAGRALGEAEISALLGVCARDPSPAGARDAAIVAVLLCSGLRRAELAAADVADYDPSSGALVVREGKGRKGRVTYVGPAREHLQAWLAIRGGGPGPLFLRMRRGGRRGSQGLTGAGVWAILRRRAGQAGLRSFSPHDLRRTWLGEMLDAGADLAVVQALAGHADPKTTAGYDRRGERARQRAAALVRLPPAEGADHGAEGGYLGGGGSGAG